MVLLPRAAGRGPGSAAISLGHGPVLRSRCSTDVDENSAYVSEGEDNSTPGKWLRGENSATKNRHITLSPGRHKTQWGNCLFKIISASVVCDARFSHLKRKKMNCTPDAQDGSSEKCGGNQAVVTGWTELAPADPQGRRVQEQESDVRSICCYATVESGDPTRVLYRGTA